MKRRRSNQLILNLIAEEPGAWIECRGLFSSSYLRNHLVRADFFPKPELATELYDTLKDLWTDKYESLWRQGERYTCSAFLEPVLKSLGWALLPEKALPPGQFTKKRPDFCLYSEAEAFQKASVSDDPSLVYGYAATVLEAKKVNHPLDRVSRRDTPGWFPSQQIQHYLRNAKDAQGSRYFNWAILTNGQEWRLYCEQAATDATFVFNLVRGRAFCTLDDFLVFLAMFSPEAFRRNNEGFCRLDAVREQSIHLQTTIETRLRRRIIDVPPCVFDADSVRLTPVKDTIHPYAFLATFNSDILSFLKMRFFQHTAKWEIGNLRQLPIVMPAKAQENRMVQLATAAIDCKRLTFSGAALSNEQAAFIRSIAQELNQQAPSYLRPPAQQMLLVTAADGLAILELAVNWEAEKLYGVEGLGPFDEF
jgi:hypothetical protein